MNNFSKSSNSHSTQAFPSLGSFSLDDFEFDASEDILFNDTPVQGSVAQANTQYHIIVKRNDGLYKTLSVLNTIFSILAVLLIAITFIMVCYSLLTITEVAEMMGQVKEHNVLETNSNP